MIVIFDQMGLQLRYHHYHYLVVFLLLVPCVLCQVKDFISLDCGGTENFTDPITGLPWISDSEIMSFGASVEVESPKSNMSQYRRRREFPIDDSKYCYKLNTQERRRYLVRATFQYGSLNDEGTYPKFKLYLDATEWSTVTIFDASREYVNEMIIRAPSDSIDVCICCATTGSPFISTLELRPLNLSMYTTNFEDAFFMRVSARVNFGAKTKDPIRYPDDPYDRIWDSDLVKRQNYLVGVAPGTERVETSREIDVNTHEYPPVKVMQTGVVGTEGWLSYRLNLEGFPGNARAYAYLAEIESLAPNETRKFKLEEPKSMDYGGAVVNIAENANGSYRLYEPSFMNVSLEFVLSFSFTKTKDSARGPLLNAIEISRYVEIGVKTDSRDLTAVNALQSMSGDIATTNGGDPCAPTHWEWVNCSSNVPPRITTINLSGKNLNGEIPLDLNNMDELEELWLNDNSLTGLLPDFTKLVNLKILHLENNQLIGPLPSYIGSLPSLKELYIQNNSFSGDIPTELLNGKITFEYEDNPGLHKKQEKEKRTALIIGVTFGAFVLLIVILFGSLLFIRYLRRKATQTKSSEGKGSSLRVSTKASTAYSASRGSQLMDDGAVCYISFSEIEEATNNFSKKVGKGSFGSVYYGRMKDGKEIAVKIMAETSSHGDRQFVTELALLSRIHHRNLVPLIGYCEEDDRYVLVYEYMHNGTLRDHIHGSPDKKRLDWLTRLRIAEDAAKGLEYLHTGCNPGIIHRDVKTSNILLDINMRAKVSDFGLSRQAEEDLTHVSSVARGTVGYVDPEYYACQQLTEKSDVYSFGVVLLELISGKKAVSPEDFGSELNIVHWARSLIRSGDVVSITDPYLIGNVKIESIWRIAEVAIQCVEVHGVSRPRMQEIILAIQEAMKIERGLDGSGDPRVSPSSSKTQSSRKTLLTSFLELEPPDLSNASLLPTPR